MPFNLRNIFSGSARPEHPDYEHHDDHLIEDSHHSPKHRALLRQNSRESLSPLPLAIKAGPISRGATVVDYDNRSDSSSLLSEGVFVQDADHIPAVHRQMSRDRMQTPNLQRNHHYDSGVPVRPRTNRRDSSESASTRSSGRTSSDPEEVPPRIIPEFSRRHSEYRSEYTSGTRYTNVPPETIDRSSTRSKRDRRRKRRSHRSRDESSKNPIILMFENGRGGYDNMWYIYPGESPVIFQDANGNEITRVGDFSNATTTSSKPPIVLDRYGRAQNQHDPYSYGGASTIHTPSAHHHGTPRSAGPRPVSPSPSVTFINLHSSRPPHLHNIDPLRAQASPGPNVIYMDEQGRKSPSTSSRSSSRSESVFSDEGRTYVSHAPSHVPTVYVP